MNERRQPQWEPTAPIPPVFDHIEPQTQAPRHGARPDVVYSPDDGGWYAVEASPNDRTTAIYSTANEARAAANSGEWDDS